MAKRNLFVHPAHRKKRLGQIYLNNDLSRRIALRTHIFLLDVLKYNFGEVDEAMFHDVERPFERISDVLGIKISDLDFISDNLSRQMALRINNLLSARLKKLLW
jgi:hypothetical protein